MSLFPIRLQPVAAFCLVTLCLSPAIARQRSVPAGARQSTAQSTAQSAAMCAYQAQQGVARRHGLAFKGDGTSSSRIYADPEMSREADDAFDACIRKQAACGAAPRSGQAKRHQNPACQ